ncbi:hypothetical protein CHU98_g1239 [Xylaria longipes]|nr:hypothetical protein CHU98_g1239 [Xylaria longipes]
MITYLPTYLPTYLVPSKYLLGTQRLIIASPGIETAARSHERSAKPRPIPFASETPHMAKQKLLTRSTCLPWGESYSPWGAQQTYT